MHIVGGPRSGRARLALIVGSVAVVVAGMVALAGGSYAQSAPPQRFFGSLTIDGQPAPAGTTVVSEINGRDCGSRTSTMAGLYVADANDASFVMGCGGPDSYVVFKVGMRYAAQFGPFESGSFTELNLTISGAATRPLIPTASPSPSPTPTPSATPAGYTRSLLDLNEIRPCIPVTGQNECDATRLRLWNGDQAAWAARFISQGLPEPTPDQVFEQTLGFRVENGDPATIAAFARGLGWPHVRITGAQYGGTPAGELDEWVEIRNLGGAEQDMTGWSVRVESGTAFRWTFQDGFVMAPGQACRFYSGPPQADACPAAPGNTAPGNVLPNATGTLGLWVDFLNLKAIEVTYAANPNQQPIPPNLQGVQ